MVSISCPESFVGERKVRCETLNFIKESKVGTSTLLANISFEKFVPMIRLRSAAKETKPS